MKIKITHLKGEHFLSGVHNKEGEHLDLRPVDGRPWHRVGGPGGVAEDVILCHGAPLLCYRPGVIHPLIREAARPVLRRLAVANDNRGPAAGLITDEDIEAGRVPEDALIRRWRYRRRKQDGGGYEERWRSLERPSGAVGYKEATPDHPACRLLELTPQDVRCWTPLWHYVKAMADVFAEAPAARVRYLAQLQAVDRLEGKPLVVPGTPFTTATINWNFRTAVHIDEGDLLDGFGVMSVLRQGRWGGCEVMFPAWGVAVDMCDGDVLLTALSKKT
jgi:hypothetical protein